MTSVVQLHKTKRSMTFEDVYLSRSKIERSVSKRMPGLSWYAVEDAVSEALTLHLESVQLGTYKPKPGSNLESEMVVAAICRAKDEYRKDPMTRMSKKAKKKRKDEYTEGYTEPIMSRRSKIPIEDFFEEYADDYKHENELEKKDLRKSLQGLVREILDVVPDGSRSVLSNYLGVLDCSQGNPVRLKDVSAVCGMTPDGVHKAVKRTHSVLNRQHRELIEKYQIITNGYATTYTTTL